MHGPNPALKFGFGLRTRTVHAERQGQVVQVEVEEDARDDRRVGDERENLHLSAATGLRGSPGGSSIRSGSFDVTVG